MAPGVGSPLSLFLMFSNMVEPLRLSPRGRNSGPPAVPPGYEGVHFRDASGLLPLVKMQLAEGIQEPAETIFLQQPFDVAIMTTFKVRALLLQDFRETLQLQHLPLLFPI